MPFVTCLVVGFVVIPMIEGVHHAYAFGSESSRHGADRIRKLRHLFRFVSAKEDGDDGFHRRRVDYDS